MNKSYRVELLNDAAFDPLSLSNEASFTQAGFYGSWQEQLGRKVLRLAVKDVNSIVVAYAQCIEYVLPFGRSYVYIPYGPVLSSSAEVENVAAAISDFFRNLSSTKKLVFVRFDFTPALSEMQMKSLARLPDIVESPSATYASSYFQPRTEWFLDLSATQDELSKQMHQKTRYSIGLAERKGLHAEIVSEGLMRYLETFYDLMQKTAKRDGFHLHSKDYYRAVFADGEARKNSFLSITRFGEEILSINIVVCYGSVAMFLFGGSGDSHRNLAPSYLTQWAAIKHSKKIGLSTYNFGGISSDVYPRRGWGGITAFKKKFGGREAFRSSFFDAVIDPFWYRLYISRKWFQRWFRI